MISCRIIFKLAHRGNYHVQVQRYRAKSIVVEYEPKNDVIRLFHKNGEGIEFEVA